MKYIITVIDTTITSGNTPLDKEVFRLGIDEFDALQFCAALKSKTRGRKPGKGAKEASG